MENNIDPKILLDVIFESAVDGIIIINERGIMQLVNNATTKLFGYSKEELIGQTVNMLMPQNHAHQHDTYIQNYLDTGIRKIIGIGREVVGLRKDSSTFPFKLSVSEVQLDANKAIFAGFIHDISKEKSALERFENLNSELEQLIEERTNKLAEAVNTLLKTNSSLRNEISERKKIEEELYASREEAKKALERERELSELKSRFITTASHEFRTPLSTILSSAKLITRYITENEQSKRERHINRIEGSVNNLTNILDDLLSWSKLQEGKVGAYPKDFQLVELMREVIEEMRVYCKKKQVIEFSYLSDESNVFLDEQFLKNILINLLSNALKYSDDGTKVFLRGSIDNGIVKIEVEDQGIGIPLAEQPHLFERFFRANNVANIQGTGLGLNIVQKYLDLMNGSIGFVSVENKGTTFYIQLPQQLETSDNNPN